MLSTNAGVCIISSVLAAMCHSMSSKFFAIMMTMIDGDNVGDGDSDDDNDDGDDDSDDDSDDL